MNRTTKVFVIALSLSSLIYFYRNFSATHPTSTQGHEHSFSFDTDNKSLKINEDLFERIVIQPYRNHFHSLVHLIVFVDPAADCPSYLAETAIWEQSLSTLDRDYFDLTVFISTDVDAEILDYYLQRYHLEDRVVYYDHRERIHAFRRGGLLKVCYRAGKGISWFEFGQADPGAQASLPDKIRGEVKAASQQI